MGQDCGENAEIGLNVLQSSSEMDGTAAGTDPEHISTTLHEGKILGLFDPQAHMEVDA